MPLIDKKQRCLSQEYLEAPICVTSTVPLFPGEGHLPWGREDVRSVAWVREEEEELNKDREEGREARALLVPHRRLIKTFLPPFTYAQILLVTSP